MPHVISIFIVPPSIEELERRLRGRGTDSEEKIQNRLERAKKELEKKSLYEHIVVNDKVDRAVNDIISIISADI
jgi:guanylate kinase